MNKSQSSVDYNQGWIDAIKTAENVANIMQSKDISVLCAIMRKTMELKIDPEKEEFQTDQRHEKAPHECNGKPARIKTCGTWVHSLQQTSANTP